MIKLEVTKMQSLSILCFPVLGHYFSHFQGIMASGIHTVDEGKKSEETELRKVILNIKKWI